MDQLSLRCRDEHYEAVLAELYELGTEGVTEHDEPGGWRTLEAFFAARFEVAVDAPALAQWSPAWRAVDEAESAGQPFEPLAVGERFYLVPAWLDDPAPAGRLRLAVHARQASGSGYQPATQLALMALEEAARAGARGPFLDVGTGSGILAAAAALLEIGPRFGCDLDAVALAEARENLTPAALFSGSARAIATGRIGLAAANLNAEAILTLAGDLARVLDRRAGQGRLILSGFTDRNLERVLAAFDGFEAARIFADGKWRAAILSPVAR